MAAALSARAPTAPVQENRPAERASFARGQSNRHRRRTRPPPTPSPWGAKRRVAS